MSDLLLDELPTRWHGHDIDPDFRPMVWLVNTYVRGQTGDDPILAGSEIGNPISVDDAFPAPLCGLTVYGRSTQDGTPTPDAPVPIVSAGDGGSVAVKVTGKNLLNPSLFQNNKYQSFNVETGYYEIDSANNYWITGIQPCLPSTTYHFNVYTEGGCFYDEKKNVIGIAGFEFTVKTPAKCAYYCVNFSSVRLPYGSPVIATVSEPATYSPYREQLLTLPTPNGLPGIPVTSGGNYTDSTGQQWVCDEVDLTRGVRVQRVNAVDLSTCKITGTTELAVTKRLSIMLPLKARDYTCLLYTSDAADEEDSVDLGGRRTIKKNTSQPAHVQTKTILGLHRDHAKTNKHNITYSTKTNSTNE